MKLLLDHNLSPKLIVKLGDIFEDIGHIEHFGMSESEDRDVWEFARRHDYTIITKDSDFHDMSILRGPPPQLIWLRCGNSSTIMIEKLIREHLTQIVEFEKEPGECALVLR